MFPKWRRPADPTKKELAGLTRRAVPKLGGTKGLVDNSRGIAYTLGMLPFLSSLGISAALVVVALVSIIVPRVGPSAA